jgi:hypothetical protein
VGTQVTVSANQIDKQRLGYCAISLDSLTATTAVTIKAGSKVEVGGALYEYGSDETESGGTWAGIGASNTVYVYIVPSGASISFIYSTTAPTWDVAKQGWYNGTNRAVASLYKDAAGLYTSKYVLTSWSQSIPVPGGARNVIKTSGALGTITVTGDVEYILTAASTVTLPAGAPLGCRITFKAKTNATSTISCGGSQTIGNTSSTSFVLYAMEDYVTLEWDGVLIWYVVATNGPVQYSDQTNTGGGTAGAWTAIGNGLTLGSLNPGVYDIDLDTDLYGNTNNIAIAIGNGTTPISNKAGSVGATVLVIAAHAHVRGYVLTAAATIQGIYYASAVGAQVYYLANYAVGRISARRTG